MTRARERAPARSLPLTTRSNINDTAIRAPRQSNNAVRTTQRSSRAAEAAAQPPRPLQPLAILSQVLVFWVHLAPAGW